MLHIFNKSLPFIFILFTFTSIFAQDEFRRWQPEDGVAVRQGWHVEWYRSGVSRTEGELAGEVAFVWSDCRNGYRDVYMQVIDTNGDLKFDENGLRVTSVPSRQEHPVIYPSIDGGWFIGWVDFRADTLGDIYCTKVNADGEQVWGENGQGIPVSVVPHAYQEEYIQIVEDNDGGCILVWQDRRHQGDADIYAMHVNNEGEPDENWEENGNPVVREGGYQYQISTISDGEGGMIIVWKDNRDDRDYNIWAQRIMSNSELLWDNGIGVIVCDNDDNQEKPKLCSDGANGAFIAWVDERHDETDKDIYAQHIDSDGQLFWGERGSAVCTEEREQNYVQITATGENEAIICWEDKRNNSRLETRDIYAMKISGDDEMIREWEPENGVAVVSVENNLTYYVMLSPDGEGGAYFTWEDERDNWYHGMDVWAQRINQDGDPVWDENGIQVCQAPNMQCYPLVLLSVESCTVIWHDLRNGNYPDVGRGNKGGISIQRISPQGECLLEEDGRILVQGYGGEVFSHLLLSHLNDEFSVIWLDCRGASSIPTIQHCRDNGNEVEMLLQKDGQQVFGGTIGGGVSPDAAIGDDGSIFVVWQDRRRNQVFSIYAQKLSEAGELQWGESGIRISEESIYEKNRPKICTDANGGIYVVWESDTEEAYFNLFMQHIDAAGNRLWDEDIRITNREMEQYLTGIIPDGEGGVVLVWRADNDVTDDDIWAARINSDGEHIWGDDDNGLIVCNAELRQRDPQLIRHQNGYVVVWVDGRDNTDEEPQNDIFAQFINYDGSFRWRENGAAICAEGHHQDSPSIAIDNQTNIWVVWVDSRYAYEARRKDLYFQKFSSRATDSFHVTEMLYDEGYGREGIPLCSADNHQLNPNIVHDAHNGMWIVWEDSRNRPWTDVYATHLNNEGVPFEGWGENGQVVSDAFHRQESPQAVLLRNSGETGIVTTWIDNRSTSNVFLSNIYTQRLDDDHVSVERQISTNSPAAYLLDEPYPNPFNSQTMISYTAKSDGHVTIGLYDITGRLVRQLTSGKIAAGSHRLQVNAEDLSAGQYIVRLEAGGVKLERRIVLVK